MGIMPYRKIFLPPPFFCLFAIRSAAGRAIAHCAGQRRSRLARVCRAWNWAKSMMINNCRQGSLFRASACTRVRFRAHTPAFTYRASHKRVKCACNVSFLFEHQLPRHLSDYAPTATPLTYSDILLFHLHYLRLLMIGHVRPFSSDQVIVSTHFSSFPDS